MHDRPDPEGAEPTPYLPAWLDAAPGQEYRQDPGQEYVQEYGQDYGQPYGPEHGQVYGPGHGRDPGYGDGSGSFPGSGYGNGYGQDHAQGHAQNSGPGHPGEYYPRPQPAEPPEHQLVPVAEESLPVPTRREARAVRGRRGTGGAMRAVLVLAALACLGVFGYWGWSFYQGSPAPVQEGDCIAALSGTDVKPLDCADARARFQVMEIFTGTSDVTTCQAVLGATNPLVVDRDGRSDVWCAAPK